MAQCLLLLLLLSRCCYFPPLLPLRLPQPTSFSVSFSCSLSRQLKLIRIFIKFQCLKGCKTSCTWPLPLPHPLHPSSLLPLLSIVVAQNALQRFTVPGRAGGEKVGGESYEDATNADRNAKRRTKFVPPLPRYPAAVTVQELGEKRRLAGHPLGLA